MSQHAAFLQCVLELVGTPYIWGGKYPASGLDCSGLVTYALHKSGGPDWRATHNTDKLWQQLPEPRFPCAGDLAFYGGRDADVEHVMVVLPISDVEELVIGACGGDSRTTSLREARRRGAKVQVRQGVHYRAGFRGYRKLPID